MIKKQVLAYILVSVLLVAALSVATLLLASKYYRRIPSRYYPGIAAKTMAAEIEANLPVGSSQAKVSDFLDRRHIEHSDYLKDKREIDAVARTMCWRGFLECSIEIKFIFDANGQLLHSKVTEILTGV